MGGLAIIGETSFAAGFTATASDALVESAIPELDLRPQDNLVVSSQDTANWVLSYPAVLPLVPPPSATWAREANEAVGRGALAETVLLMESVPADQQDGDWQVYRANLLLRIGLVDEADAALRDALVKSPSHPKALALASVVASIQGRKDNALDMAEHATRIDPTSSAAWLALSYTQQARGELAKALASTRLAQTADSNNETAWVREAELSLALGRIEAARNAADRSLALQPDSYIAHSTRAMVALLRKDWKSALSGFEQATRLNPVDANARFGLGLAYARSGELGKARDELETAVARAPKNSLFQAYLGRVYLALKENEKASAAFERAKLLDPNNPSAWMFSGQMHLEENRPASALEDIQAAIRRNEGRKVYRGRDLLSDDQILNLIDLSHAWQAMGFSDLALHTAQDAVASGGEHSASLRNLADAYSQVPHGIQARRSLALQSLFDAPSGQLPIALDVVAGIGSTANVPTHTVPTGLETRQVGLNEYAALFAPSEWQFALDGNVASFDTRGEQVRLGGKIGSLGIGFAQLSQSSDGLDDKRLDNQAWQALLQANPGPGLSAFLEYRHATSLRDEIFLPNDPILTSPLDINERIRVARLGLGWRSEGGHNIKLLLSRQWRDQGTDLTGFGFTTLAPGIADMPEIQYQGNWNRFILTLGASRFGDNGQYTYSFDPTNPIQSKTTSRLIYGYGTWQPKEELSVSFGVGNLHFHQNFVSDTAYSKTMPKFGVSWHPLDGTLFRFAALEAAALPKTGGAALEPIEVAGVQQWFGDEIGTLHRRIGMNLDQTLSPDLKLILEGGYDKMSIPGDVLGTLNFDRQYERQYKAGLYWRLPRATLASWEGGLRLTYDYLDQDRPDTATDNNGLKRQIARHWTLGSQLSGPRGLGFNFALTRVGATQTIEEQSSGINNRYSKNFWMTDLALTWKIDRGRKQLSLGVKNAADQDIGHYQEADILFPRFAQNRFFYGRLQWQFP